MTTETIHEFVENYEFRGDMRDLPDHTPIAFEKLMIEDAICGYLADHVKPCVLTDTVTLMGVFFPDPGDRQRQTQLGVHFEEVGEMIETLAPTTELAATLLAEAHRAIVALASHMKNSQPGEIFLPLANANDFLDSVADQLVTAAGSGAVHGMNPVGALGEVNRSNRSKLGDDGQPIYVEGTGKWAKGPNYTAPDLSPFLLPIS